MYKFNRMNNLQKNIKQQVTALGENEETFLGKSLYENFKDVHQQTTQYINKTTGLNIDWSYVDDKFIDSAIKQNWQGGNFSSRVWNNKDKLIKNLNKTIVNGIASGQSINTMAAQLKSAMGTGAYDALRLIRTETMHTLNNAQMESFKNAGYGKVIWLAAEDERTCEVCGELNDQSFDIDKAPDCPAHANCRCTLSADPESLNDSSDSSNSSSKSSGEDDSTNIPDDENNSENQDTNDENSGKIKGDYEDYKNQLIGLNTSDGITISDLSLHGYDRIIGDDNRKGVGINSVKDALTNPLDIKSIKIDDLGRKSKRYIGEKAEVAINPDKGNIVSVNPTSTKKAERLLKKRDENNENQIK
ncbi:phage putative head morphogenesis protein, SPP1 gp7 family [Clostridium acidisoli DSM 12555]|uniref:Phage putative head morphogenesis protein, SPP1 gp7 family n=2 Tax=Clostridium TaxID=1485 RepID=A0A1W1X1G1_9CLOT|nr:phage putative head morphogenesis protein, SPP1 gp7 family [Clostridium acidisoli DSM 12555]